MTSFQVFFIIIYFIYIAPCYIYNVSYKAEKIFLRSGILLDIFWSPVCKMRAMRQVDVWKPVPKVNINGNAS